MPKKQKWGVICLDLGASLPVPIGSGLKSARLVSKRKELSRNDKAALEFSLGEHCLKSIEQNCNMHITGINKNKNDPPDIFFKNGGVLFGLEVTEIVLDNRIEKDKKIVSIKEQILKNIKIGENTKNWVITISLENDYSDKLDFSGIVKQVTDYLSNFFLLETHKERSFYTIPETKTVLDIYRGDLSGDPRLSNEFEPLIVFSSQNVNFIPDEEIPKIVNLRLQDKFYQSVSIPTWLLLWSSHFSLMGFDNEILASIKEFCLHNPNPYQRIIYHSEYPPAGYHILFFD